jgi:PAS domain S-box-containing protein
MLASAKPVHIANWYVCVLLPIAEAYAPIHAMQYRIFSTTFFLMCLVGSAMWWMLKHELAPLSITLKNLASWKDTPNNVHFLPTFGREEIDELIDGFNRLLKVLQERENHLQAIIDTEPECIKIVNQRGQLVQMNAAGLRMIEADSLEQVVGRSVISLVAPEYRAAFMALHEKVIAGETVQLQFEVIGLKNTRHWMETHAAPMFAKGERVHLAVTRDITARKKIELQLRESEAQLQLLVEKERENSVEKSNFLAMLTHELKSPLATIEMATGNIQRSHKPEIIALSLKHIQTAAYDMSVITERCLQADKLEQANSIINLTTFPIEVLINDRRIQGQWLNSEDATRLQVAIHSLLITSDEFLCRMIVSNLIENALKYSPAKSDIFISAIMDDDKKGVLISIANQVGKAGKPDAIKVFQKYYRNPNAQRERGTGLGLWLVRGIATQLGGTANYIEHNNKVEFQLWLPQ